MPTSKEIYVPVLEELSTFGFEFQKTTHLLKE